MSFTRKYRKFREAPRDFFQDSKWLSFLFSEKKAKSKLSEPLFVMMNEVEKSKKEGAVSTAFKLNVKNTEVRAFELMASSLAHLAADETDKAIEAADVAVAVCPEIPDVYINASQVRSSLEDKAYVYAYAKQAFELWPNSRDVFVNYVKCSLAVGDISGGTCQMIIDRFPFSEEEMKTVISYIWEASEYNSNFTDVLIQNMEHIRALSNGNIALLGAYLFANNKHDDSLVLARDLIDRKKSGIIKKYKYWYEYVDQVFSIAFTDNDHKTLKLTKKVREDIESIEQLIKSSKRVVVVGNSPCEVGKTIGGVIDSADLVIRFNNYPTDKKFEKDYGKKTSIWVRSVGAWVEERSLNDFEAVVLSATNPMNRGFQDIHFHDHLESNNLFTVFPESYQYDLISILGGPPSAGLMMVYWLYKLKGQVRKEDLFGFGFVDQLSGDVENIGKSPAGVRHHWSSELEVFEKLVCGDGI